MPGFLLDKKVIFYHVHLMLFKTLKIGCKQFESSLTCKSVDYSSKLS